MSRQIQSLILVFLLLLLSACSSDPGPLEGTWQKGGIIPMKIQFRNGETEVDGIVKKVAYEIKGDDITVTYQEGFATGSAMRYTMTSADTMRTATNSYKRIK